MALEQTLEELAERRAAFAAHRIKVDEELRQLRVEKLAAEQAAIEGYVVKAMAEGATLGQVKRAYGTKDHRTIATIVTARAAEIEAVRKARETKQAETDWFTLEGEQVVIEMPTGAARFEWTEVDGELMFITDEPLWDPTMTVKNEAVALLDGKTESTSAEARSVAQAIRKRA